MSAPWWVPGPDPHPPAPARWTLDTATSGGQPVLLQASRSAVVNEINARIAAYTPDWTGQAAGDDAGVALVSLFGTLMEPVLSRLNRLPEKARVAALDLFGIDRLAAEPASATLQFTILPTETDSVLVPAGFKVGARADAGTGGLVVLETQANLYATAAQIAQVQVQEGSFFLDVTPDPSNPGPFAPFGADAAAGRALYLGLQAPAPPQIQLTIGIEVVTPGGIPAPVAAGGLVPVPPAPTPVLVWEVYDGGAGAFTAVSVLTDSTKGMMQSGIVTIAVPAVWSPGTPPGIDAPPTRYWLRLRIAQGRFDPPPQLTGLFLNAAPALAVQTYDREFLDFGADPRRRYATLSHAPVRDHSPVVTVRGDPLAATDETVWQETVDLAQARPDQPVYEFDPASGALTFGDGVHGAAIPPGFRNVTVTYQAISPSAGVLAANAANTLIDAALSITQVTNPSPGSGGSPTGSQADALRRGPQQFRARGRAVTPADFALLATQVAGIVRAQAIAGRHPAYPGKAIPGVVGVYVVPPDTSPTPGQGPAPIPTAATLHAVAKALSESAALAGIDVVAAAPVYHFVQAQIAVVADPAASTAAVYRDVRTALTNYLHPITGGPDGNGWPFGATLAYTPLLLALKAVDGVRAIPSLTLVIDGQRLPACSDFPIGPDALFWSLRHQIVPGSEEGAS